MKIGFVRRHAFLLLGLATLATFYVASAIFAATSPLRPAIIPMYLGWLGASFLTIPLASSADHGVPLLVARVLGAVSGLLPYMLADALLARLWRPRALGRS